MARKRRKVGQQLHYDVEITGWRSHMSFNDYAYANIWDDLPYQERYYFTLRGTLISTTSQKVKEGQFSEVVVHHGTYPSHIEEGETTRIGNMEMMNIQYLEENSKNVLMFRVAVPEKSFEHLRVCLAGQSKGRASLVGTDLYYRKGEISYFSYDGHA